MSVMLILHETLRRKVQFGLPLTLDEQRYCVEKVTGSPVVKRGRCKTCNATGKNPHDPEPQRICIGCRGEGYVDE